MPCIPLDEDTLQALGHVASLVMVTSIIRTGLQGAVSHNTCMPVTVHAHVSSKSAVGSAAFVFPAVVTVHPRRLPSPAPIVPARMSSAVACVVASEPLLGAAHPVAVVVAAEHGHLVVVAAMAASGAAHPSTLPVHVAVSPVVSEAHGKRGAVFLLAGVSVAVRERAIVAGVLASGLRAYVQLAVSAASYAWLGAVPLAATV